MNQVIRTINERRSTRAFTAEPVGREEIEILLDCARFAPSAMNEQSWKFTAVVNAEKLLKLSDAVKRTMASSDIERIRARSTDDTYNFYYRAPVLIIASAARDSRYPAEDCACALQNIFLAAQSLGLGSCWINQLTGDTSDDSLVRALLNSFGIPSSHRVYGCAAVGHIKTPTELKPRAENTTTIVE